MEEQEVQSQEEVKDSEESVETPEAETPEVETPEQEETQEEKEPEEAPESEEPSEEEKVAEAQAAYEANLKFKVMDKEHEFDDFLRDVITNEDREKRLRELYEKAYGLDFVKPKYQEVRDKYKDLEKQHTQLNQGIESLDQMVQRGDFDGFFDSLKLPKEKIYQWVVDKVKYQQASPEEKQRIDSEQRAQREAWSSTDQAQSYQQQLEAQKVQFLQREMDLMFLQPDVKQVAAAYDAKVGKPNAFFDYVKERGETAWVTKGQEYTAKQAVEEAVAMVKPFLGQPGGQQTAQQPASGQSTPPQTQKPRVIPNVQGRGNSPIGTPKVKSLDDLKRLRQEIVGN